MGLLIGQCYLNRHLLKLGLADSPRRGTSKRAIGAVSHIPCEWDFSHMKLSTWIIILWNQVTLRKSPIAAYCTSFRIWGCWMCALKGCTYDRKQLMCTGHYSAYFMYYILFSHNHTPLRSTNCFAVRCSYCVAIHKTAQIRYLVQSLNMQWLKRALLYKHSKWNTYQSAFFSWMQYYVFCIIV